MRRYGILRGSLDYIESLVGVDIFVNSLLQAGSLDLSPRPLRMQLLAGNLVTSLVGNF